MKSVLLSVLSILGMIGITEPVQAQKITNYDVVFCGAPWCSGCQKMKPVIKQLETIGYKVYKAKQGEWKSFGAKHVPTTIIFRNGKEVKRFVGFTPYRKLDKYLPRIKVGRYDIGFFGRPWNPESIIMEKRMQELIDDGYLVHSAPRNKLHIYNIERFPTVIIFLNGYEVKRFEGLVSTAEIKAYLRDRVDIREAFRTTRDIEIVLAGYDNRRVAISVIGRVLEKKDVRFTHITEEQYAEYEIVSTPTIIFYEDGVEKYRLCSSY